MTLIGTSESRPVSVGNFKPEISRELCGNVTWQSPTQAGGSFFWALRPDVFNSHRTSRNEMGVRFQTFLGSPPRTFTEETTVGRSHLTFSDGLPANWSGCMYVWCLFQPRRWKLCMLQCTPEVFGVFSLVVRYTLTRGLFVRSLSTLTGRIIFREFDKQRSRLV